MCGNVLQPAAPGNRYSLTSGRCDGHTRVHEPRGTPGALHHALQPPRGPGPPSPPPSRPLLGWGTSCRALTAQLLGVPSHLRSAPLSSTSGELPGTQVPWLPQDVLTGRAQTWSPTAPFCHAGAPMPPPPGTKQGPGTDGTDRWETGLLFSTHTSSPSLQRCPPAPLEYSCLVWNPPQFFQMRCLHSNLKNQIFASFIICFPPCHEGSIPWEPGRGKRQGIKGTIEEGK